MKRSHILLLAALLSALLAAVALRNIRPPAASTAGAAAGPAVAALEPAIVAGIQIGKGAKPSAVQILKDSGTWRVASLSGARADPEKVGNFLAKLTAAGAELRGRSKDLFADFGIRDEEGVYVKLADASGRQLSAVLIGTVRPEPGAVFMRRAGSDEVYLAAWDALGELGVGYDTEKSEPRGEPWLSLRFFPVAPAGVRRLEIFRIENGQETKVCGAERNTAGGEGAPSWKFLREGLPFGMDPSRVEEFLGRLAGLQARAVLAGPAAGDMPGRPQWRAAFGLGNGREIAWEVYPAADKESGYRLKTAGESVIFELPFYVFESMDADDSEFFGPDPFGIGKGEIKRISVFSGMSLKTVYPGEGEWDGLAKYREALKNFRAEKLLFRPEWVKKLGIIGRVWLEILKEDGTQIRLDVGEQVSKAGESKVYEALLRGSQEPFAISEETFKELFEGLDSKLTPPAKKGGKIS